MNNPPAFPGKQKALMIQSEHVGIASEYEIEHNGMTLRDYFAAKALQGLMHDVDQPHCDYIAQKSYQMADAMLAAREKA